MSMIRFDKVDDRFDAMSLRVEKRFDALATRIYWSAGIVTACLTIALAIMTYVFKSAFLTFAGESCLAPTVFNPRSPFHLRTSAYICVHLRMPFARF